jgi:hypothetical protein
MESYTHVFDWLISGFIKREDLLWGEELLLKELICFYIKTTLSFYQHYKRFQMSL